MSDTPATFAARNATWTPSGMSAGQTGSSASDTPINARYATNHGTA